MASCAVGGNCEEKRSDFIFMDEGKSIFSEAIGLGAKIALPSVNTELRINSLAIFPSSFSFHIRISYTEALDPITGLLLLRV